MGPAMTLVALAQGCADTIHEHFRDYQRRFHDVTQRAPDRFTHRQWAQLQADTAERLNLYKGVVDRTESLVRELLGNRVGEQDIWVAARGDYAQRIALSDDRELAETFFNSVTRRIFDTVGVNRSIEFVHDDRPALPAGPAPSALIRFPLSEPRLSSLRHLFAAYDDIPFDQEALERGLPLIAERLDRRLGEINGQEPQGHIEMLSHVFYRSQGAYLIGRIVTPQGVIPLVAALLHASSAVVVDALLLDADGVSIVFSYTRSAFHVVVEKPAELVGFLKSILPVKPEAELYSGIGYFKHAKTVLYRDVCRHTAECSDDLFRISPGRRGMVMVVFEMPGHEMVVKLIRDRFDNPKHTTRAKVMQQYEFVFNHYRVGRLIEANAFEHISFDRCWFSDDLLEYLVSEAGETVRLDENRVIIDHCYLERRVTPLDIYLAVENDKRTDAAVLDFGNAIKDLAVANIFPGDMLLKNFGVTRHGRVVFYDYDEIVPLTDCRFRKIPQPRTYMEEMAAEPWYTVEENDVFPEEFSRFLGLSPRHRDLFLSRHADLLRPDFWVTHQQEILNGHIRHVHPYHSRYRLTGA